MEPQHPGNPPGIPSEVTVFRMNDDLTDQEATSDGSFQHVELESMDTYEDQYTAETEEVVEIPVPKDLITEVDRELWRTLYNQSSWERNWRRFGQRMIRKVRSNTEGDKNVCFWREDRGAYICKRKREDWGMEYKTWVTRSILSAPTPKPLARTLPLSSTPVSPKRGHRLPMPV